jgi:glutamine amidotransferase
MCRWFAYIANEEACLLEDVLCKPAHAITRQVDDHYLPQLQAHEPDASKDAFEAEMKLRNKLNNSDGFGFCWLVLPTLSIGVARVC